MAVFTRGFGGRRRESDDRLPPGQYLTEDFPVLSAGPTPRVSTDEWRFTVLAMDGVHTSWSWDEVQALPIDDITTDIHCVTRWSKLGTHWRGVSLDHFLEHAGPEGTHAMVHSYGGYTTNVPRADLSAGKAWVAFEFDGEPLAPEHGGPARLIVPHLYFWKSAKWVRSIELLPADRPGFWEQNGYNMYGDPWKEERYW
ncbi:sulfite oxidase-like oxidoreductase [Microbacterium sp. HMH0099]|uniref:sulfite oxidase-like oxidoreductase n=1 Tax=Microbacterium sp. HMH0099 TaxID=3414026 RepID=UPI003BF729D3